MLTIVVQRFGEDTAILAELAHLKKPPTPMGPEPAMEYVCRAVWSMLYVDNTCIDSRPPQGLAKMIEVIRVREKDRGYVHAFTAYIVGDDASRSGRENLQTRAFRYVLNGRRDQNPRHVR